MVSIQQFAIPQGWTITGWQVSGKGSIPPHVFTVGGTLLIAIVQGPTPACSLVWLDLDGQPCTMANLPFQEGVLVAPNFPVKIGEASINCTVDLSISAGVLNGTLTGLGGDGNAGTFAADANPGG